MNKTKPHAVILASLKFRAGGSKSLSVLACLALLLLAVPLIRAADDLKPASPAEEFVLEKLRAGTEADLAKFSPLPKDRILRHQFVENLITGRIKEAEIQLRGVAIRNAIFKEAVEVSGMAVPARVWLQFCEFQGGLDFSYTRFGRDLSLRGSQFGQAPSNSAPAADTDDGDNEDQGAEAFLAGMRVEEKAVFSSTVSYVPVDFTYAEFSADVEFYDVVYHSTIDLSNIRVRDSISFVNDEFARPLELADAELFKLFLKNPRGGVALDMSQARIEHGAVIENAQLLSWKAGSFKALGRVKLDGVTPTGKVDLSHSHFGNLLILNFERWLKLEPGLLNLEGLSFDTVDVGEKETDLDARRMLQLLNAQNRRFKNDPSYRFSPQPYLELEKFLRAHGDAEEADDVYIEMRRGERRGMYWVNKPWDFLLDIFLGYGKDTWRTVVLAICITVVGAFIFAPNKMEWKNLNERPTRYSRFWYSLDEFAPVIDLGLAKDWGPYRRSTRYYARFQRIAGWVLLPLILGALTGIVK
jgi:hypothetical protein